MRYRILASFQGAPYEAGVGPDESDVVLFAACPPPEELRFEPATGHWRKRVDRSDVQTLYESRPVGMFRGERCIVLDDLGDRLHIVYLGHDALRAAQLGYWEVDRGVFELITPRHEVTDIVEQRRPLPIRSDSGQHTRPGPMPSQRSDDFGAVDGQPFGYGSGDHDGFPTGPQLFHQRGSLDGLAPSYSQDLPITAKPADQAEVAIPPVPEPPLPLEAEALRAASSAARRGQKTSQSRQAPPTGSAPVPAEPVQDTSTPAEPPSAPASAAAAPQVPIREAEVRVPAAEASQPPSLPAPSVPAAVTTAAMLSKAAMLSHAAATAARQAAASEHSTRSEQEDEPRAEMPAMAGLTPATAIPQRQTGAPEQPASAPDLAPLPPAPVNPAPESASRPAEPAPASSQPAKPSGQVGGTANAEAARPTGQAADPVAPVDQPTTAQVAADGPVDAHPHGSTWPNQSAPAPHFTAAPPAADSLPVPVSVTPPASEDRPTAPDSAEPAPALSTEPATTQSTEPAITQSTEPAITQSAEPAADPSTEPATDPSAEAATTQSAEAATEPATDPSAPSAPDHPDATVGTPLVGISDPPSVAHPTAASAVPSWVPRGPVQPQPGYDAAHPAAPTHDIMPGQAEYFAPYLPTESVSRNGVTANGTAAAVVDLGLTTPVQIQQPGGPPSSNLMPKPQPVQSSSAIAEPTAQAQAGAATTTRRRRSTKRRLPTQKIFSDLATQAAIPAAAYAIGEEVDGAMCLVRTDEGFEVFNAVGGARHEVRVFQDEESAYFYLFGVLVAESVRTGALVPRD